MKEVLKQALEALEDLLDHTETPPDKNCSCHIAPPCFDCVDYSGIRYAIKQSRGAITAIKEAIREHAMYEVQRLGQEIEQEPVGWIDSKGNMLCVKINESCRPLYTHPCDKCKQLEEQAYDLLGQLKVANLKLSVRSQRTWIGLTEDDKALIKHDANFNQFMTAGEYADRVQQLTEARLKDKNT